MQDFGPSNLIAAVHTPFDSDGELHLKIVERQAELLRQDGISTVFVAGTTGECTSLTVDERLKLVDRWCDVARHTGQNIIVHVGSNCLHDTKRMTQHADQRGVLAVSAFAPNYFKPASVSDLVDWCEAVACVAPETPFYFYDIPPLTGVQFPLCEFLALAAERIPNLAGVKYSHQDLLQLLEVNHRWSPKYEILFGVDEILLSALVFGTRAAVGSTYNMIPSLYHQLIQAYHDHAMTTAVKLQDRSLQFVKLLQSYSFMPAAKAFMAFRGVDVGSPRLPNRRITYEDRARLHQALVDAGYL